MTVEDLDQWRAYMGLPLRRPSRWARFRDQLARLVAWRSELPTYVQCQACDLWRRDPTEECPRCGL